MLASKPFNTAALATEAKAMGSSPMYISIIWEVTVVSVSCQSSTLQGEPRKQVKTSFSHLNPGQEQLKCIPPVEDRSAHQFCVCA